MLDDFAATAIGVNAVDAANGLELDVGKEELAERGTDVVHDVHAAVE